MRKVEETVLGMELEGERVIKDVMQTQITFTNQRIQSPAENEQMVRMELKYCIFEGLVNNALENISVLRARRRQLETEQRVLGSRLRSHGKESAKNDLIIAEKKIELEQIQQALEDIGFVTPEASLEQVNLTLGNPQDYVSIESISLNLDRQGILRPDEDLSNSISKLDLSEVSIQGQLPRVVTLVRIQRDDLC